MTRFRTAHLTALAAAAVGCAAASVQANPFTWSGLGTTTGDNYGNGNNWVGNSAPPSADNTDLIFNSAGNGNTTINSGTSVGGNNTTGNSYRFRSITFTGADTAAYTFNMYYWLPRGAFSISMDTDVVNDQTFNQYSTHPNSIFAWQNQSTGTPSEIRNDSTSADLIFNTSIVPWDTRTSPVTLAVTGAGDVYLNQGMRARGTGNYSQHLTMSGSGTLTIAGDETHLGRVFLDITTNITAGTVLVNNTGGSAFGSGTTTVTGGTLGGTGALAGAVSIQNGGKLAPGTSIGTLTLTGGLEMQTGSTFALEFDTLASDLVDLAGGILTAGNGVTINTSGIGTPTSLVFMTNVSDVQGDLSTWSVTGDLAGYLVQYDGNDVFVIIPEPASLALLGLGTLMMFRRSSRQS